MPAHALRRQILLSTTMIVGALAGYARGAYAQQCLQQGATSTFLCNGASGLTQDLTFAVTGVNNTAVITDAIPPQFSVDTRIGYGGFGGNAMTISSDGDISYTDYDGSPLRGEDIGLSISSTGDYGGSGSVFANFNGEIRGTANDALNARNYNTTGALTIYANGNVITTGGDGIDARNGESTLTGAAGSDIVITTAATTTVQGAYVGIVAFNDGSGEIDITANGNVYGGIISTGIRAQNGSGSFHRGTDITITTGGTVRARYGIVAHNYGSGATTVEAHGNVEGTVDDGIVAYGDASTIGDVTVTTYGTIEGTSSGINARNQGTGDVTVDAQGYVTGFTDFGIRASNTGQALSITTGANSTVDAGLDGINAFHSGTGALDINVNGNIDSGNNAVFAQKNTGTSIDVTVAAGANVVDSNNGIHVRNYGGTVANVIVNGTVTGTYQHGIYGRSTGGAINITVNQGGTVSGTDVGATDSAIRVQPNTTGVVNLTVAGTLNGGGGGAVRFDQTVGQNDRVELQPTFVINGNVLAGGGTDTLAFGGAGNGTFNLGLIDTGAGTKQYQNFEMFEVDSGIWSFSGSTSAAFTVNGGTLKGTGTFGGLTVNGGTVAPGNSIGTMTVNGAFTLAAGTVYEVEVNAQGQSDKVIVNGTVNLTGSVLRVLAANGDYDPKTEYTIIDNDGVDAVVGKFAKVTSNFAFLTPTVAYDAGTGNDVVLTLMRTVVPASGGGKTGGTSSGFLSFCSVAQSKNQCGVAEALDLFPTDNELFQAVLTQTEDGARAAFDALDGEIHASVAGSLADDSRYVREAILGRLMQANYAGGSNTQMASLAAAGPQVASIDSRAMALGYGDEGKTASMPASQPLAFWTHAYGAWGNFDGNRNAASADRDLGGFVSGMDAQLAGSWRAGLATGASFANVDVDARYSSADVESYMLGGYLGGMAGAFALRGGGAWAWSNVDTSRAVVFPNFYERQKASYDADTGQLFGEVAYPTQMLGMALEPFGGLAYVSIDTDSFKEHGGKLASLRGRGTDEDVGYSTLGLRAAQTMMWGAMQVTPHLSAAWQHAFDDVTPDAALAFATTGIGFNVTGVPLAEDSALIDAGLDLALGPRTTAGVSYTGQYGDGVSDNGVKGRFTWLF